MLTQFLGEWTPVCNSIISNTNLSRVGRLHGLDSCVMLNPGTISCDDWPMATTVEAIIGLVHLEGGNDALEAVLQRLGLTHMSLEVVTSKPPLSCLERILYQLTCSSRLQHADSRARLEAAPGALMESDSHVQYG